MLESASGTKLEKNGIWMDKIWEFLVYNGKVWTEKNWNKTAKTNEKLICYGLVESFLHILPIQPSFHIACFSYPNVQMLLGASSSITRIHFPFIVPPFLPMSPHWPSFNLYASLFTHSSVQLFYLPNGHLLPSTQSPYCLYPHPSIARFCRSPIAFFIHTAFAHIHPLRLFYNFSPRPSSSSFFSIPFWPTFPPFVVPFFAPPFFLNECAETRKNAERECDGPTVGQRQLSP